VSAREHVFMLQNCASGCVNNRTYRTLQETGDKGASCSSGQGSGALIGSLRIQALPTDHEKTRSCCCTCSCHKILCCNLPSDKIFLRKRACVRPRFNEHCAGVVNTFAQAILSFSPHSTTRAPRSHRTTSSSPHPPLPSCPTPKQPRADGDPLAPSFNRGPPSPLSLRTSLPAPRSRCSASCRSSATPRHGTPL